MNAKIVRLNSGEEILCDLTISDDGTHNLKKPLIIIPSGGGNIGFMGWMPYADIEKSGVNVPDSFVVFVVDPDEQLKGEYDSYTSDIVAPPKKDKLVVPSGDFSTIPPGGGVSDDKNGPIGIVR